MRRRRLMTMMGALGASIITSTRLWASPRVTLSLNPTVALAPVTIRVRIAVYDFPEKAAINVTIFADNGYQAVSVLQLPETGGDSLHLADRYYPLSERGGYTVQVTLETGEFLREAGRVQIHASAGGTVEVH